MMWLHRFYQTNCFVCLMTGAGIKTTNAYHDRGSIFDCFRYQLVPPLSGHQLPLVKPNVQSDSIEKIGELLNKVNIRPSITDECVEFWVSYHDSFTASSARQADAFDIR